MRLTILNQSASKKYVSCLSSRAMRITSKTKIDLKTEPAITLPVESIYIPPSFLPIVSQTLNVNIVI